MAGGPDLTAYPRYYIPYSTASREAAASGKAVGRAGAGEPGKHRGGREVAGSTARSIDELVYLPLRSRAAPMSIVVDKGSGDVVGVLPLEPR